MTNIVLCDDDREFILYLDHKIRDFLTHNNIQFTITHFYTGEALLQSNLQQIDILFLDVRMAKIDGLKTAAILRKRKANFVLIFISQLLEYAPYGYEVQAIQYIMKDQLDILFERVMERALKKLGYFRTQLDFEFVDGHRCFYSDDLVYIQSDLHMVSFHFLSDLKGTHLYGKTLNSIYEELPTEEFVRIHQSYIVNLKYLLEVKNYSALLIKGIKLPISQKRFADTKKQFYSYKGRV